MLVKEVNQWITQPFASLVAGEPMDTSLPPDDRSGEKDEEPMETEAISKPHPSASTPVSQNSPSFVLERTLSLPSQPQFSHVFASFYFYVITSAKEVFSELVKRFQCN